MGHFIGTEKIAALGEGPRYRVYQDKAPCHHCRDGGTWAVLDTVEDILIGGISYHREEDAEWLADQLNDAVAAERNRVRNELLADLEPEIRLHRIPGSQTEIECVMMSTLRAAMDRICPQEET